MGLVRKPWAVLNMLSQKWIEMTCGITLPEGATIGRRLRIEHYGAIIVHGGAVIGDDCLIRQGVTIGNKGDAGANDAPKLGDRVEVGAGAKLIGDIQIGDDAKIGANAVVTKNVPAGHLAVGVPAAIKPPRQPSA
jgi:serine O-acetyltransferase